MYFTGIKIIIKSINILYLFIIQFNLFWNSINFCNFYVENIIK